MRTRTHKLLGNLLGKFLNSYYIGQVNNIETYYY